MHIGSDNIQLRISAITAVHARSLSHISSLLLSTSAVERSVGQSLLDLMYVDAAGQEVSDTRRKQLDALDAAAGAFFPDE